MTLNITNETNSISLNTNATGWVIDDLAFPARSDFVTWNATATKAVGLVVNAGGFSYRYIGTGTAISDLVGWVPNGLVTPIHWGCTGSGDDTTKLEAMFTYLRTLTYRRMHFPAQKYQYEGSGLFMRGAYWEISADKGATIWRSTDGKMLVIDARLGLSREITIDGLEFYSTLAEGSRPNTHAIELLADQAVTASAFQCIKIRNCTGSGIRSLVHQTKTSGETWEGFDQLQRVFEVEFTNLNGNTGAGARTAPDYVFLGDSGTGNHITFLGGFYLAEQQAVKYGDGDMAVHDTTFVDVHFLGKRGGLRILGPTDPAKYRKNIAVVGCQFDGATSGYTYSFENMSAFTVSGCNTQSGVSPVLTNCTSPYIAEDQQRNIGIASLELNQTTGLAVATGKYVSSQVTTDRTAIIGGTTADQGAKLQVYGPDHATTPDQSFIDTDRLRVRNIGASGTYLDINTGTGIIDTGAVKFDQSAGLSLDTGKYIYSQSTNDRVAIVGGTTDSQGAKVQLFGPTHASTSSQGFVDLDRLRIRTTSGVSTCFDVNTVTGIIDAVSVKIDQSAGLGVASSRYVYSQVTNDRVAIVGGTTASQGAKVQLFGPTHATTASQGFVDTDRVRFRNTTGSTTLLDVNAATSAIVLSVGSSFSSSLLGNSTGSSVGYGTGSGSTVTQITSKSTGVTIDNPSGRITTDTSALAANTAVQFTVTCSACSVTDVPLLAVRSPSGKYVARCVGVASGSFVVELTNITSGSLSEAVLVNYTIFKGSAS